MKKLLYALSALLLVAAFTITGCSSGTASTTELSPLAILSKSYDAMQGLNSFHFVLTQAGGGTPITNSIEMTGAEGDIIRPDKLKLTIDGNTTMMGATVPLQVQMVTAGGQTMMTNPLSGKWEVLSQQFNVLAVFNPGTGVAAIVKSMSSLTLLADEQLGGVACYHLRGTIVTDQLKSLTGTSIAGASVNVEAWIGKNDFLVRQIKLTGKITDTEKDGIVRTLALSDFNETIDITLPQ